MYDIDTVYAATLIEHSLASRRADLLGPLESTATSTAVPRRSGIRRLAAVALSTARRGWVAVDDAFAAERGVAKNVGREAG